MQFISNPSALPVPVNEPRPRMFWENAPQGATHATKGGLLSLPTAQRVKLQLVVNPANGEVRGYVSTNDGILTPIHPADAPVVIPSLADPNATNLTAGIISHNPAGTTAVTGTYDDFVVDVPSKILSISPAQGAQGVAADGNITVTFDQAVSLASATAGISLTGPSGPVAGAVALSPDGKVATFDPGANLANGSYTVNVATSVTDATGNPLLTGATATFAVGRRRRPGHPASHDHRRHQPAASDGEAGVLRQVPGHPRDPEPAAQGRQEGPRQGHDQGRPRQGRRQDQEDQDGPEEAQRALQGDLPGRFRSVAAPPVAGSRGTSKGSAGTPPASPASGDELAKTCP